MKEADALHGAGYQVTVIATRILDLVEPRDQSILERIPWHLERIDLRSQVKLRRLRVMQLVARKGFEFTNLRTLANPGFSALTKVLMTAARRIPADLYIAHYPAALPAAATAARLYGTRYAYDAEDFHLGDLPEMRQHFLEKQLIRIIEARYLAGAAYVTAASPLIADAYANEYGIHRPNIVLNVFPRSSGPVAPTAQGTAKPGPSVYWFSQTIGTGRGLETAVAAIGIARSQPHLFLRGTPSPAYSEQLQRIAQSVGVSDRLHFLPPAIPAELERLGAQYDLGYAGETDETPNRQKALSNKLFSYLLGGVPILASDTPAHVAMKPRFGSALELFSIGDTKALAEAMDRFLLDPACLRAARCHAWELGQSRFCWDLEKESLLLAIEKVFSRHNA